MTTILRWLRKTLGRTVHCKKTELMKCDEQLEQAARMKGSGGQFFAILQNFKLRRQEEYKNTKHKTTKTKHTTTTRITPLATKNNETSKNWEGASKTGRQPSESSQYTAQM